MRYSVALKKKQDTISNMEPEEQTLQNETVEELFNGDTISPQFALALKKFMKANGPRIATGFATIANGANHTVAHGLGGVPNFISVSPYVYPSSTNVGGVSLHIGGPVADATNLYFDNSNPVSIQCYWVAAIF